MTSPHPADIKPLINVKDEPKDPAQEREEHITASIEKVVRMAKRKWPQNSGQPMGPYYKMGMRMMEMEGQSAEYSQRRRICESDHEYAAVPVGNDFEQILGNLAETEKMLRRKYVISQRRQQLELASRNENMSRNPNNNNINNDNNGNNGIRKIKIVQLVGDRRIETIERRAQSAEAAQNDMVNFNLNGGGGGGGIRQIKITQQRDQPKRRENEGNERQKEEEGEEEEKVDNCLTDRPNWCEEGGHDSMLLVIFTDKSLWWNYFKIIKLGTAAECLTCGWKCSTRQPKWPTLGQFQRHLESRHPQLLAQKEQAMQTNQEKGHTVADFLILPHELVEFLNQCYKRGISVAKAHHELCLMKIDRDAGMVRDWYGKFSSGEYDRELLAKKLSNGELMEEEQEQQEEISKEQLMAELEEHGKITNEFVEYHSREHKFKCPVCKKPLSDMHYLGKHMELVHGQSWMLSDLHAICNLRAVQNNEAVLLKEKKKIIRQRKGKRLMKNVDKDKCNAGAPCSSSSLPKQKQTAAKENDKKCDDKLVENATNCKKVEINDGIKKEMVDSKILQFMDNQRKEFEKLSSEVHRNSKRMALAFLTGQIVECLICKRKQNNLLSLRDHLSRTHEIKLSTLALKKHIHALQNMRDQRQDWEQPKKKSIMAGEPAEEKIKQGRMEGPIVQAQHQPEEGQEWTSSSRPHRAWCHLPAAANDFATSSQTAFAQNERRSQPQFKERQPRKQQMNAAAADQRQIKISVLRMAADQQMVSSSAGPPPICRQRITLPPANTCLAESLRPNTLYKVPLPFHSPTGLAGPANAAERAIASQLSVVRTGPPSYTLNPHQFSPVQPSSSSLPLQQQMLVRRSAVQESSNNSAEPQWNAPLMSPKREFGSGIPDVTVAGGHLLEQDLQSSQMNRLIKGMANGQQPRSKMHIPSSTNEMLWKRVKDEIDE